MVQRGMLFYSFSQCGYKRRSKKLIGQRDPWKERRSNIAVPLTRMHSICCILQLGGANSQPCLQGSFVCRYQWPNSCHKQLQLSKVGSILEYWIQLSLTRSVLHTKVLTRSSTGIETKNRELEQCRLTRTKRYAEGLFLIARIEKSLINSIINNVRY